MAVLTGYAVPLQGGLPADHTYVLSSDNFSWPCWGRDSGGADICSGSGSSTAANCISQTNSHSGLIYGVTGVCHQTANRILYPARVLVSRARGYGASVALYGTYGRDAGWYARLARCMQVAGSAGGGANESRSAPDGEQAYIRRVLAAFEDAEVRSTPESDATSFLLERELSLLLDHRLGARVEVQESGLHQVQRTTLERKEEVDRAVLAGDIRGREYAERVNVLATEMGAQFAGMMERDAYARAFDVEPGAPVIVVEPEVAEEVYG